VNDAPLLFDIAPPRPTTRAVAHLVKSGGLAALPSAIRRADEADYQEVTCRSALNRVEGMPFNWTLNPYRGCTHGCHYCFARRYHVQFELDCGDQFASVILVKTNLVDVLERELAKRSWRRELVAVGTATDPYQPIEGRYRLTRRALEALVAARTPVGLVTKGPMAVRDKDLLAEAGRTSGCTVYFSVPTVHEEAWAALEPGTAHPLQRLRAVRELRDAGVRAGVLIAPVVPGFTDQPDRLDATMRAIADHGAAFCGANVLYLKGGTRDHFLTFISQEYPRLIPEYERLFGDDRAYAPAAYVSDVQRAVRALQERHGLAPRRPRSAPASQPGGKETTGIRPPSPEQAQFAWQE
jgi:DNA repair photolyase